MTDTLEAYAKEVIDAACERNGITPDRMLAFTSRGVEFKDRKTAKARSDACRLLRATVRADGYVYRHGLDDGVAPLSYPAIGRLLGGLNHSTVILAERRGSRCHSKEFVCTACDGTGKLPPLTWDAYMEKST